MCMNLQMKVQMNYSLIQMNELISNTNSNSNTNKLKIVNKFCKVDGYKVNNTTLVFL